MASLVAVTKIASLSKDALKTYGSMIVYLAKATARRVSFRKVYSTQIPNPVLLMYLSGTCGRSSAPTARKLDNKAFWCRAAQVCGRYAK